jgi:hypothetical protein
VDDFLNPNLPFRIYQEAKKRIQFIDVKAVEKDMNNKDKAFG